MLYNAVFSVKINHKLNLMAQKIDHHLDLTEERCPTTFIRVKMLLKKMQKGETACVQLADAETIATLPDSLRKLGYVVLLQEEKQYFSMIIHKNIDI